jgi:tRNA(Ile)-lysidine synthase
VLSEFKTHIKNNFPGLFEKRFLLAVSGGLDSMVLTHLCLQQKLDFELAHCNFKLRGKDSDDDEKFVVSYAKKNNLKLYLSHFDTTGYVKKSKVSVEIAARELRYAWFAEIMNQNKLEILVTAHHADDDLETFLINLSRGTGIDGLKGIPAKTDSISRPLLPFSRAAILKYAKKENIAWREDVTNLDTVHLRNQIRHEVIPELKKISPSFLKNFKKTQEYLSDSKAILDNHAQALKTRLFSIENGLTRITIDDLLALQPQKAYLHLLFKDYGFTAWKDILGLLEGMSGKKVYSKTHRLVRDRNHLILEKLEAESDEYYYVKKDQMVLEAPIKLEIQHVKSIKRTSKNILYVDDASLKYPLVVRKWKKGDYFYPFGMSGKKKLSKYFKDEKIDIISKNKQWLLCSGDAIVWVVGKRADERFKVSDNTKKIIQFRCVN